MALLVRVGVFVIGSYDTVVTPVFFCFFCRVILVAW